MNTPEISTFELFQEFSDKLVKEFDLNSKSDSELPKIITSDKRTPEDILALFAETGNKEILERIACNPNTPKSVLMKLINHKSTDVRIACANNNKAADCVSEELAEDESLNVKFAVASNPHSSGKALNKLEDDENPYVARRASKTLTRLEALDKPLKKNQNVVAGKVASN